MCFIKGELRGLWFDKPLGGVNVPNLVAGWLALGMLGWDGFELLAGIVAARQLSLQIIVLLQIQVLVSASNLSFTFGWSQVINLYCIVLVSRKT